jgi:4-amino-4-deoxy-L-arabinose transferase-like glycosyltransferase
MDSELHVSGEPPWAAPGSDAAGPSARSTGGLVARLALAAGLMTLFTLAFWVRVSSLGAFPWHDADESYYGVQTAHLLQGKAFELRTTNKNILNPYLVAIQAPLHLMARPALWVLRAPAALCGILAVVLTYVIGARVLDRTTALIAAMLLAALPYAIHQSRVGLEMSQLPLAGLIVIGFALRGRVVAVLLALLGSILVHPTAIFLVPIALTILLVQLARTGEGDPARRRRVLIGSAVGSLVVAAAVSALIFNHPLAQIYLKRRPPLCWPQFLDGFERALFFLHYTRPSKTVIHIHRWVFRSLAGTLLVLGVWRLVRERRWERLALIAGVIVSLVSFHVVAGPRILRDVTPRYGIVFLLPTALAFACLLECLRAPGTAAPAGLARPALHRLPVVVALILAWLMLLSVNQNFLGPGMNGDRESLWTLQADQKDEYERTLSLIRRDVARRRRGDGMGTATATPPTAIIVHDYWALMPLAYLASFSNDFEVVPLINPEEEASPDLDGVCREKGRALERSLRSGAYAIYRVGVPVYGGGTVIEDIVNSTFGPGEVQRWEVRTRGGGAGLIVYRLGDGPDRGTSRR